MSSQAKGKIPVVETALLGHGLPSVEDNLIAALWPSQSAVKLAWLEEGEVRLGSINEFLPCRKNKGWARVSGKNLSGFLFKEPEVKINGVWPGRLEITGQARSLLLLNSIPSEQRLNDRNILLAAEAEGETALQGGKVFHPAVNAALDRLTAGLSSETQLKALVHNIIEALTIKPLFDGKPNN